MLQVLPKSFRLRISTKPWLWPMNYIHFLIWMIVMKRRLSCYKVPSKPGWEFYWVILSHHPGKQRRLANNTSQDTILADKQYLTRTKPGAHNKRLSCSAWAIPLSLLLKFFVHITSPWISEPHLCLTRTEHKMLNYYMEEVKRRDSASIKNAPRRNCPSV